MTDSHPADSYALPRDAPETARLNEQHEYLTKAFGFLIYPSTSSDNPDLRVADIACGSGVWLTDVAARFPFARCDGFDISGDQFPSSRQLEENGLAERVRFHVHNAADPTGVGAAFAGAFDVVAVRLMHIDILGAQSDQAVKNAVALLKPEGYLQWIDWDPLTAHLVQTTPLVPRSGKDELLTGFRAFLATRHTASTARLPQMMRSKGLEM
ncbi:hypothetical protein LTR85_006129 [Meristemomyces frigidus]|nr:hypothetical protein LTR85_006129 [Meristemomyces frigidus]